MNRARITWLDATPATLINGDEASVTVLHTGLVIIQHGDRQRFIPPSSYKFVDIEGAGQ